jgi:pimeloyl-ACP methyl ester carboxylesterase
VTGLTSLGESKEPASWAAPASPAATADAGVRERSPRTVLIVTGMGMRGELEDDLCYRVGHMFDPPVPVPVHRYGVVRSGSVFGPCQRVATRRLAERLRALPEADGLRSRPPDIIAHSFGAWLVGHALQENPDLRVGRIIMAGSVLRPDFDWCTIIGRGQAEAVLNHYGSHDLWAFVSEFFIPDSGPAGFRGFGECPRVFNRREPRFRHLTFFQSRHVDTVHRTLWRPFLTRPADELGGLAGPGNPRSWRPRPWLLRANLLRALLLLGLAAGFSEVMLSAVRLMAGLLL